MIHVDVRGAEIYPPYVVSVLASVLIDRSPPPAERIVNRNNLPAFLTV